ncbi:MAG: hypothetical protein Kow0099_02310 [Candidatus Abyssubacteria bacterium]
MYLLFEPWLEFFKRCLAEGSLPLWNPHQSIGHPFLASINAALLYPFSWLALLVDVPTAMLLIQFLNIGVGMVGMGLYCRFLGLNWPGTFLGVAALGFLLLPGSFVLSQGSTMCWTPLIFLSAHSLIRNPDFGRCAALAAFLALSFLGGFPQFFFYVCVIVAVYCLFLLLLSAERKPGTWLTALGMCALSLALTTGLIAAQLLPTAELSQYSIRDFGKSFGTGSGTLAFQRAAALFYVAISAGHSLFIPLAFASRKDRSTALALTAALAYSLLFVLSKEVAALSFLGNIPFVDSFRYPDRMLRFSLFLAATLAAIGMSSLWSRAPLRFRNPDTGRLDWFWILTTGYVALALYPVAKLVANLIKSSSGYLLVLLPGLALLIILFFYRSQYSARVRKGGILLVVAVAAVASFLHWDVLRPVFGLAIFFPLLLTVLVILHYSPKFSSTSKAGIAWALVLLLMVILYRNANPYQTIPFTAPLVEVDSRIHWIMERVGYDRVFIHRRNKNIASSLGFYSIADYEPFTLARWRNFVRMAMGPKRFDSLISYANLFYGQLDVYGPDVLRARQIMGLASLRYFIVSDPLSENPDNAPNGLRLCHQKDAPGKFYVYENEFAVPRAYLVNDYLTASSEGESLGLIKEHINDLFRSVVLEKGSPSFPRPDKPTACGTAHIKRYEANEAEIEVEADQPALLVLTDSYFPGWNAYVDGDERPIWPANSAFRAVEVGPGHHVVVFRYSPASFKIGAAVSLCTVLAIIGGLVIQRILRSKKRSTHDDPVHTPDASLTPTAQD